MKEFNAYKSFLEFGAALPEGIWKMKPELRTLFDKLAKKFERYEIKYKDSVIRQKKQKRLRKLGMS